MHNMRSTRDSWGVDNHPVPQHLTCQAQLYPLPPLLHQGLQHLSMPAFSLSGSLFCQATCSTWHRPPRYYRPFMLGTVGIGITNPTPKHNSQAFPGSSEPLLCSEVSASSSHHLLIQLPKSPKALLPSRSLVNLAFVTLTCQCHGRK